MKTSSLRPTAELLDAQDLTLRIHWAIRDAYLHQGGIIPSALDWSDGCVYLPVPICDGVGIVEQHHRTLNWLLDATGSPDWDRVDTST